MYTSDAPRRRHSFQFGLGSIFVEAAALLAAITLSLIAPEVASAFSGPTRPANWTITFRYGGGTPVDSRPYGHYTATICADGHVKIVALRIWLAENKNVVLYENDALPVDLLQAISQAADAALREKPFTRPGSNEDGMFLRLDRLGAERRRVYHNELGEFWDAPPAMLKFAGLINGLLPPKERWPLAPDPPEKK